MLRKVTCEQNCRTNPSQGPLLQNYNASGLTINYMAKTLPEPQIEPYQALKKLIL